MAKQISAWKGDDGVIYETWKQATDAEIRTAVEHITGMEKSHLMNVALGLSSCKQTRDALRLIAERLPPDHAVNDAT